MDDAADENLDLELLTASLRADAGDIGTYTEALAVKLEEALPSGVRVQRVRQGMFGPKLVRSIVVDAGSERLELERDGDRLTTRAARVSGGITIKTEAIDFEQWLAVLSQALAEQARRSLGTRQALDRLLNE
jgi:hypothetical protein